MALKFRTRLNISFAILIFLVAIIMFGTHVGMLAFLSNPDNIREFVATFDVTPEQADSIRINIEENTKRFEMFRNLHILGSVLVMFIIFFSMLMSRGLTKPLSELSRGARQLGEGNLNYRFNLRGNDEFSELAQSFNIMAISLQEHMHELQRETSDREKLESEFRIAYEMQQALLPEHPPEVPGLDLAGWSQPSKEVGGDFYDFLDMGEDKIGIALGDATGKGVPAALLTTQCSSVLRTIANKFHEPDQLLFHTNNEFYDRVSATHRFVTLFLLVIDMKTGKAQYATAGHPAPLLINSKSGESKWLGDAVGFPLGIVHKSTFTVCEYQLTPGDTIVIYSDGLTDARNNSEVLYNDENLEMSVKKHAAACSSEVLSGMRKDVVAYMEGNEATDDMTIVVAKYTGKPA
jgi:phosphoserine phosphatase RsbU/P